MVTTKTPVVKRLDELKLVGYRVLCPGDQYIFEIPKASKRLSGRIREIKQVIDPLIQYGAFVVDNHSEEEDGYWVCVEVTDYEDVPEGMMSLTIPSQLYATLRHLGPNYKIRNIYADLHNWIEANEFTRLKDKWHLEKFYSWSDSKKLDVELLDTIE